MVRKMRNFFLEIYEDESNFIIRKKAGIILNLNLIILIFTISFLTYFNILNDYTKAITLPIIGINLSILFVLYLLKIGKFVFASHLFLNSIIIAVWTVSFLQDGPLLQRFDTIIIIVAALSLTPIISISRLSVIAFYYTINVIILIIFLIVMQNQLHLSNEVIIEFALDSLSALIFSGFVSYQILKITNRSIENSKRSEDKLIFKNEELVASLEELEAINEEFEAQNEELFSAQGELEESEDRYKTLFESAAEAIIVIQNGVAIFSNPATEELTGHTIKELSRKNFFDLIYSEDKHFVMTNYQNRIEGKDFKKTYETRIIDKENNIKWISINITNITWHNQFAAIALMTDITERKVALDKLLESEKRFKIFHNASFGAIGIHDKGKIIDANLALSKLTGFNYEELMNMDGLNLIAEEYRELVLNNIISKYSKPYDVMGIKKNGSRYHLEIQGKIIPYQNREVRVTEFRDITDKIFIENEFRKMQQLESLGVLAGGIAHDFNNILSSILGNISLLRMETINENEKVQCIEDAEKATLQAQALTSQLLTFSKGGTPLKESSSIQDVINDAINFTLSGSNVICNCNFSDDLWQGNIDRGQIAQVVQNLVINGKQSMPDGGQINITVKNFLLNKTDELPLEPGKYLELSIIDSGIGISQSNLNKIFDPYFSTKRAGHGLGLSVVYSIIKKHGGHISVESEYKLGTSFKIYLPATDKAPITKNKKDQKVVMGRGKILFMDDEEIVRKVAERMLRSLGYNTILTSHGKETIEEYSSALNSENPFDLVILDITIPGGMGGKETMQQLLKIDENIKGIISSGYANDPVMAEFKKHGFKAVMNKPYKVDELSRTIHQILG